MGWSWGKCYMGFIWFSPSFIARKRLRNCTLAGWKNNSLPILLHSGAFFSIQKTRKAAGCWKWVFKNSKSTFLAVDQTEHLIKGNVSAAYDPLHKTGGDTGPPGGFGKSMRNKNHNLHTEASNHTMASIPLPAFRVEVLFCTSIILCRADFWKVYFSSHPQFLERAMGIHSYTDVPVSTLLKPLLDPFCNINQLLIYSSSQRVLSGVHRPCCKAQHAKGDDRNGVHF